MSAVFESVLIANRGEIAVRIIRTLRRMGIRSIAVYSDADAGAPHVALADEAIHIGPAAPTQSYLDVSRLLDAVSRSRAAAVHPGYGFLSENADFAQACVDAGAVFIGPSPAAIRAMGDKINSKRMVAAAGVPVVPGCDDLDLDDHALRNAALAVGTPLLIKPTAGGGGQGMVVVDDPDDFDAAVATARRQASAMFGADGLVIERLIRSPRHIEIQVAADAHGAFVHLGERDCSLQRRHQKVIEEAPSPFVSPAMRAAMGEQAINAARACGYTNIGTVEFIVPGEGDDEFFFMEMNTRLQVEHPVTEMAYDVDLVELQVRLATGEPMPAALMAPNPPRRHAVEARIYAEDASRGFLPTMGTVLDLREPRGDSVRVDSGLVDGLVIGPHYDPMLAKVIVAADDRAGALAKLDAALSRTSILGLTTNIGFLRRLLRVDEVIAGTLDTQLIERWNVVGAADAIEPDLRVAVTASVLLDLGADGPMPADPWADRRGWRLGEAAVVVRRLIVDGRIDVRVRARAERDDAWSVWIDDGEPRRCSLWRLDDRAVTLTIDGESRAVRAVRDGSAWWVGVDGDAWRIDTIDELAGRGGRTTAGGDGVLRSPMPGSVRSINVSVGQSVRVGDAVAVVEAMKMEHTIVAAIDGVIETVSVDIGQQVAMNQPIATVVGMVDPPLHTDEETR